VGSIIAAVYQLGSGCGGRALQSFKPPIGSTTSPGPAARVVSSARTVNLFRPLATALNRRSVLMGVFAASGFSGSSTSRFGTRYLGLVLGHAAYAQSLVLAIFQAQARGHASVL